MLPKSAHFLTRAITHFPHPLAIGQPYNIPYLLDKPEYPKSRRVYGEVYVVNLTEIPTVDDFEGVSKGFYRRGTIKVRLEKGFVWGQDWWGKSCEVIDVDTYFRDESNGGPQWAKDCTVENLLKEVFFDEYTQKEADRFVFRNQRRLDKKKSDED